MARKKAWMTAGMLVMMALTMAPLASADNVVECLDRENHEDEHCVSDCTPLGDEESGYLPPDSNTPLDCEEHEV